MYAISLTARGYHDGRKHQEATDGIPEDGQQVRDTMMYVALVQHPPRLFLLGNMGVTVTMPGTNRTVERYVTTHNIARTYLCGDTRQHSNTTNIV